MSESPELLSTKQGTDVRYFPMIKSHRIFGYQYRMLTTYLLRGLHESTVGCYAVGEFHAPLAEQQRRIGGTTITCDAMECNGVGAQ